MGKRMIGIAAVVLSMGFVTANVAADKAFSLYANIGAGFGVGGAYLGSSDKFNNSVTPSESKDVYENMGDGLKFDLGASIQIMKNVDVKAAFGFTGSVLRPEVKSETKDAGGTVVLSTTDTYKYASFALKVLIAPQFTVLDLIDIYTGIGMGLAFPVSSSQLVTTTPLGTTTRKTEDSNLPEPVFIGEIGAEYPIIKEVILTGGISFEAMTVTTTKQVITQVEANTTQTINYEDNTTDRPPTPATPATSVAIRIGVRVPLF